MRHPLRPGWPLMALGAGLLCAVLAGASLRRPGEIELQSVERLAPFVAICGAAGLLYLAAVAVVLRGGLPRRAFWGILACAAAMRLVTLAEPPFLSTDIYRYVWDGRVQAAGINPYVHLPSSPELAPLRDDRIHPHINRAGYAPTIYPPAAQAIFFAVASLSPTVAAMKAAMLGFELLALAAVVALLARAGLPRERVLILAWHPLPIWEFAGNGHVDAAALGLVALALLARARDSAALAGAALGAAALVKFLPAVLFPALWRRRDARMPAAFAAAVCLGYLCYIGAGWRVLGFLPGYVAEEGLRNGGGIFYLFALGQAVPLPRFAPALYAAGSLALLAALGAWIAFRPRPERGDPATEIVGTARDGLVLGTVLMVAVTPHYAWYFAWLVPFACFVPWWPVLYLTAASFLLYLDPVHTQAIWPALLYGPFAALVLFDAWRRRAALPVAQPAPDPA